MKISTTLVISGAMLVFIGTACLTFGKAAPTAQPTAQVVVPAATQELPTAEAKATLPPTQPAPPTAAPAALKIKPDNAVGLREVGQVTQNEPFRLVWARDSKAFGVLSQAQAVIYDAESMTSTESFALRDPLRLLDISADGFVAAFSTSPEHNVLKLERIGQKRELRTQDFASPFMDAVFSPDGALLATTSFDEIAVTIWDAASGKEIKTLKGFDTAAPVYSVSFSPDGKWLIWKARGGVQLMEVASGKLGPAFDHEDMVESLALSPDNKVLACATAGTVNGEVTPLIQLWDAGRGEPLGQLLTLNLAVVAFSPDGLLLAGGDGNTVVIWDAAQRQELIALSGHKDMVNNVVFSPDGTTLASVSVDNTVRLWQVKP